MGVTCEERNGALYPLGEGPWFPAGQPVNASGARVVRVHPTPGGFPFGGGWHGAVRTAVRVPLYHRADGVKGPKADCAVGTLQRCVMAYDTAVPDEVEATRVPGPFVRWDWDRNMDRLIGERRGEIAPRRDGRGTR